MGSTGACTAEKSFIAAYGLPCKLETKAFGGGLTGSVSGSREGAMADLGLATAAAPLDANIFKIHPFLSKASSLHAHASPAEVQVLKKPDKSLPCPRCNSSDTKFCYYNNYNVNQPRHFCKGCQRYWTAGGTLRNVAIGAGRRKRKHASSLESDSQDSTIEECSSQDLAVKVLGTVESKFMKEEYLHGTSQSANQRMLSFGSLECAALSRNPPSPGMKRSSLSESLFQKRAEKVETSSNPHNSTNLSCTFYEYLRPKCAEVQPDNVPCSTQDHSAAYVEHMKRSSLSLHLDLHRNDWSSMFIPTSSDMQVSNNESGCASSLTTQAVSVDACVTDGKSGAMDFEATKEGGEPDIAGSYASRGLQYACKSPCRMQMESGGSATSRFALCDLNSVAPITPTWNGPVESKPTWPKVPPAMIWGPPAERAHLWSFPGGPAAHDVDAAKAAMIPSAASSPKQHPTGLDRPAEVRRLWAPKTLRIKDADEAARSSILSTLGIKERQGSVLSEKVEAVFQWHAEEGSASVTPSPQQHTSPAALTHSRAFQERG